MAASERARGGNRDSFLTARIPADLKQALEAEAAATGRTITQVAVGWMEAARAQNHNEAGARDLSPVGEMIRRLLDFAELLKEKIGDPARDTYAREALIVGWRGLVASTFPPAPASPQEMELAARQADTRAAAAVMFAKIRDLSQENETHPLVQRLRQPAAINLFALAPVERSNPYQEASAASLLMELAGNEDAPLEVAHELFKRLDSIGVDLAQEIETAGLLGPWEALYEANTAEHKAHSADSAMRVSAMQQAARMVRAMRSNSTFGLNLDGTPGDDR